MENETPIAVSLEEVPLGYEPVVLSDSPSDGLQTEYLRLRGTGRAVLLCDNGDGTFGLWELRVHFWLH
jgi:hypothetical protein